jgi:23S rRNA (cytidine1920-2'-O)/16S rRNA (cytidine1409-2'-O)-methyltransferase
MTRSAHRLDVALVERGLASSRQRAQALVAAGLVLVGDEPARSASQPVDTETVVRVVGSDNPYASRAGLKLAAALDAFGISVEGRVVLDGGASTGGFTDVLLRRGASLVYAVDVGRGQLLPRLAADPRVRVLDRTNLRWLEAVPGPAPSLATLDLSFISLRLVLPRVCALMGRPADVLALVKPQFELGREAVGRGGRVRDPAAGEKAARDLLAWAADALGARGTDPLPAAVRGARAGNQEWFVHLLLDDRGSGQPFGEQR